MQLACHQFGGKFHLVAKIHLNITPSWLNSMFKSNNWNQGLQSQMYQALQAIAADQLRALTLNPKPWTLSARCTRRWRPLQRTKCAPIAYMSHITIFTIVPSTIVNMCSLQNEIVQPRFAEIFEFRYDGKARETNRPEMFELHELHVLDTVN